MVGGSGARQRSRENRCRRQEHGKKKDELARLERKVGRGTRTGGGNGWVLTEKSRQKEKRKKVVRDGESSYRDTGQRREWGSSWKSLEKRLSNAIPVR